MFTRPRNPGDVHQAFAMLRHCSKHFKVPMGQRPVNPVFRKEGLGRRSASLLAFQHPLEPLDSLHLYH